MKIIQLYQSLLLFAFTLLLVNIEATSQTSYVFESGKMTIAGTSTLHDWVSDVTQINFQGQVTLSADKQLSLNSVSLDIPVVGIKSTKGKGMDKKTYGALKMEEHPNLLASLNDFSIQKTDTNYKIKANGHLTIAGTKKPIELVFTASSVETGFLKFTGSKALKMTDFGIDPPKALLGTLKTGDDITIDFTVMMKPQSDSSNLK